MRSLIKQLKALDELAWRCVAEGDNESLSNYLEQMCGILEDAPEMEELPLSTSRALIESKQGSVAIPFLECFIRHIVSRKYASGAYKVITRHYVEACRQAGMSDQQIVEKLCVFKSMIHDERYAIAFNRAVERAFKQGQYPEFEIRGS